MNKRLSIVTMQRAEVAPWLDPKKIKTQAVSGQIKGRRVGQKFASLG